MLMHVRLSYLLLIIYNVCSLPPSKLWYTYNYNLIYTSNKPRNKKQIKYMYISQILYVYCNLLPYVVILRFVEANTKITIWQFVLHKMLCMHDSSNFAIVHYRFLINVNILQNSQYDSLYDKTYSDSSNFATVHYRFFIKAFIPT